MRIVNAGFEMIEIENPLEKVERVARVCYKSEDKIKEGSAEKMVRALIKHNHTAMIEHASLVVEMGGVEFNKMVLWVKYLEHTVGLKHYLRFTKKDRCIVSGNCRAWREFLQGCEKYSLDISISLDAILKSDKYKVFFEDIDYIVHEHGNTKEVDPNTLSDEEKMVHLDLSVIFTVDRGISHEIVRHRDASFAQESTRYCNYGKSGAVAFIRPCFFVDDTPEFDNWLESCMNSEQLYLALLNEGRTPQEARGVLSTSLKTELVMTTNLREWMHFFNLRAVGTTGKPHPQIMEVAVPLLEVMKRKVPVVFDNLEVK